MTVTTTTRDKCSICGRWPATLRPAMRRAVLHMPRHGACEECHDAFAANLIAALARRGIYATAEPPPHRAQDESAPVRREPTARNPGHTGQALSLLPVGVANRWPKRLWARLTVENVITAVLVGFAIWQVVMFFFPPT